ncbi:MAG: NifU family protein [Planctomycetes bacterium]|nr:NifU family protein [Planctomycetota bacterium]
MQGTNDIRIIARPQPSPLKCDFEVDRPVVEGTVWFGDQGAAAGSPLAEKLFALQGVQSLLIRGTMVTVTRTADVEWITLAKAVGSAIRVQLQSGEMCVAPAALGGSQLDQSIRVRVQRILDEEINPAVAMHGGTISILDVQNGIVYVRMGGGCHGCASSTATLKQGVEQAVRAKVPEVVDILDTTDHAAGTNPYYAPH